MAQCTTRRFFYRKLQTDENAIPEDEDWDGLIDSEDEIAEDGEADEEDDVHKI